VGGKSEELKKNQKTWGKGEKHGIEKGERGYVMIQPSCEDFDQNERGKGQWLIL